MVIGIVVDLLPAMVWAAVVDALATGAIVVAISTDWPVIVDVPFAADFDAESIQGVESVEFDTLFSVGLRVEVTPDAVVASVYSRHVVYVRDNERGKEKLKIHVHAY